MSKKYYSIPRGIVKETNREIPQNFDLKKFFKRMLNHYNVPFLELCCDEGLFAPVRQNVTSGNLEYFDLLTSDWVERDETGDITVDSLTTTSVTTDAVSSNGNLIIINDNIAQHRTEAAYDVTATATAADLVGGLITSTSAAAVALTLPTATNLGVAINANIGSSIDFIVDNVSGANTVTVTVNTGITAIAGPVITGGATLTVASGTLGQFRVVFTSATTAKIARII